MDILKKLPQIEPSFFERDFINTIESHLTYLRNGKVTFKTIDGVLLDKYHGDFYGLLDGLNIGKQYHYAVMRVNGLDSSSSYRSTMTAIILPDFEVLESIKNVYRTRRD